MPRIIKNPIYRSGVLTEMEPCDEIEYTFIHTVNILSKDYVKHDFTAKNLTGE